MEIIFNHCDEIATYCKGRIINNISTKKIFLSEGKKTIWRDIQIIELNYKEISLKIKRIKHYFDPEDTITKNPLKDITYSLYDLNNIKPEEVENFIKSKLRVIRLLGLYG